MDECESMEILLVEDNASDAELTLHALHKSKVSHKIQHVKEVKRPLIFCSAAVHFPTVNSTVRPISSYWI